MDKESIKEKILKCIHPVVLKVLSLRRNISLTVEGNIPDGQNFIFVANHFCIDDIPTVGEVIERHIYVLVSDEDKWTLNGLVLNLNGVVWTNRLNKIERKHSKEKLLRHLKVGHSILIYPEATWNLSPNLLMLPMNYGCIALSLETSIPIIPIYLFFTENSCHVKISPPFYPNEDKILSIQNLRDVMATSAWDFISRNGSVCRADLEEDYWEKNICERYSKYSRARKNPSGVRAYEEQFIYTPKNIVDPKEVFADVERKCIKIGSKNK